MEKVLVHYDEIFLKGNQRFFFEDRLIENIKKSAERQRARLVAISKQHSSLICTFDDSRGKISSLLKCVFGIKDFSYFDEVPRDFDKIMAMVKIMLNKVKKSGQTKVAFSIKRIDKSFPLSSEEMNKRFREAAAQIGLALDMEGKSASISTRIYENTCYISSETIPGYGGLPVGTSGKVLVLLSGGIDSPVAAWEMMKRGCTVDFLHVHSFRTNDEAKTGKIARFTKILNNYQFKSRLYLLPYSNYDFHMMGKETGGDDLVLFKHYILGVAENLAIKNGYGAIVNGDNLGQVASQTLENLRAASNGIQAQIFRPLLTYNKEDIIEKAREIRTYDVSLEPYKDCCSIVSKNPNTKTTIEKINISADLTKVDELIRKSMKEVSFYPMD